VPINYAALSLGVGGEVVPMYTIDSFNLTNVSVMKIDVEVRTRHSHAPHPRLPCATLHRLVQTSKCVLRGL
jgi:hypothetical protein